MVIQPLPGAFVAFLWVYSQALSCQLIYYNVQRAFSLSFHEFLTLKYYKTSDFSYLLVLHFTDADVTSTRVALCVLPASTEMGLIKWVYFNKAGVLTDAQLHHICVIRPANNKVNEEDR